MSRFRRIVDNQVGASAVEFVLTLPLLLLVIFLLIDLGRFGFVNLSLASASREGVRLSALCPSGASSPGCGNISNEICTMVTNAANSAGKVAGTTTASNLDCGPNLLCVPTSNNLTERTTVSVKTTFRWYLPLGIMDAASGNRVRLSALTVSSSSTALCPS